MEIKEYLYLMYEGFLLRFYIITHIKMCKIYKNQF